MFRFEPPLNATVPARIGYLAIAAAPALVYALLLVWFREVDFYDLHFFARGGAVTEYNVMRVAYIACVAWLVYASGVALLALAHGTTVVASLTGIERYTAGFLTGAGLWHLLLFVVGLAGGYRLSVAYALTVPIMILTGPHFAHCIR
ncbi:MAG TPA: hypothetical protein VNF49_02840, partial [Candidatus Binataceae bacterium]|nr:hypothetical protein [Candidatus Binataceae bacterium]